MQRTSQRTLSLTSAQTPRPPEITLSSCSRLSPNRAVTFDLSSSCQNCSSPLSKVSNCMIGKLYQICLFILSLSLSLLGSPSGKLTVADHRCSVLLAIESLSLCPLSSSSQQQLASSVAEGLVTHIKQEGNIICTL